MVIDLSSNSGTLIPYVDEAKKKAAEEEAKKFQTEQPKAEIGPPAAGTLAVDVGGTVEHLTEAEQRELDIKNQMDIGGIDSTTLDRTSFRKDIPKQREALNIADIEASKVDRSKIANIVSKGVDPITAERISRSRVREVGADTIGTSQFRGSQAELIKALQAQSRGEAPSIAEMQAKRAGERALAQQMAMAAGARGSQQALARRTAAQQQAQIGADIAATSAQARLAEQLQAQQQLGQVAGQARGQDLQRNTQQAMLRQQAELANQGIDMQIEAANAAAGNQIALANLKAATEDADRALQADLANQGVDLAVLKENAALGNQVAIANLNKELTQAGLNDAMQIAYLQNELGYSNLEAKAAIAQAQITSAEKIAEKEAQSKVIAGGLGALGTLGAAALEFSDINLKKNISKRNIAEALAGDRLTDFLDKLDTYDYEYKDEKHGKGKQTSIMAQELEQSDIGKEAVIETDEGKMVDYSKLLPAMLAANVDSHKRIKSLEEALLKKNSKKKDK